MCYICSPRQYKFYGKERLTVCIEFCDEIYSACGEAILKGSKISEIYLNGSEFCRSRRFNVDLRSNDNCFYYNINEKEYLSEKNSRINHFLSNNLLYLQIILSILSLAY